MNPLHVLENNTKSNLTPPSPHPLGAAPGAWIGFDLDHAVARYNVPHLARFIYDALCACVIAAPGSIYNEGDFAFYNAGIISKGLLVDFATGDILKVNQPGHIMIAYHGHTRRTREEIATLYPSVWHRFDLLRKQTRDASYFSLLTYFDMPAAAVIAAMVTKLDAHNRSRAAADAAPVPYASIREALVGAFEAIFDNTRGALIVELRAHPEHLLFRRPGLRQWLSRARAPPRSYYTFLATNSNATYANVILDYSLGEGWRGDCFDVVLYDALKPAWFGRSQPWYALDQGTLGEGAVLSRVELALGDSGGGGGDGVDEAATTTISISPRELNSDVGRRGGHADGGSSSSGAPPSTTFVVRGHAGGMQALADATALLYKIGLVATGSAADVGVTAAAGVASTSPAGAVDVNSSLSGTAYSGRRLVMHVEPRGHVLDVSVEQQHQQLQSHGVGQQPLLDDGVVKSTTTSCHDEGIVSTRLPVALRGRKASVDAAAAVWLAHGSGASPTADTSNSGSSGGDSDSGASAVDNNGSAHAPIASPLSLPSTVTAARAAVLTAVAAGTAIAAAPGVPTTNAVCATTSASASASGSLYAPFTTASVVEVGQPHAPIIYFGDHIHGDCVAPVVECGWLAVCVLEELEHEAEPIGSKEVEVAVATAAAVVPRTFIRVLKGLQPSVIESMPVLDASDHKLSNGSTSQAGANGASSQTGANGMSSPSPVGTRSLSTATSRQSMWGPFFSAAHHDDATSTSTLASRGANTDEPTSTSSGGASDDAMEATSTLSSCSITPSSCSPSSSYFGWLLDQHAELCVSDVETAVASLLPLRG